MNNKIVLFLFIGAFTSFVFADEPSATQTSNQRLFDPFALKGNSHFDVTADALFFWVNQDGLDFVTENKGSTTSVTHGHLKDLDFGSDIGFRLGLDYKLPHDQWDLNTRYTYFHASAAKSETAPEGGALFPTWAYNGGYATHAKAKWFSNLNRVDLELGRNCLAGKWVSIRPFMGVTGVMIDQELHLKYEGGTVAAGNDEDKVRMSNNFWGVGIRFGFNSLWGLGKGFSLYADGSGSLLSGHFHVAQKEYLEPTDTKIMGIQNRQSTLSPILEIVLGLQWDHLWDHDRYHFGAKIGWEFNQYFNQNRFINLLNNNGTPGFFHQNEDDLSFMGITVGFRFDF